jgi:hypothetical protein
MRANDWFPNLGTNVLAITSFGFSPRMGVENWIFVVLYFQSFLHNSGSPTVSLFALPRVNVNPVRDQFGFFAFRKGEAKVNFDPEIPFSVKGCLSGAAPNAGPLLLTAFPSFFSEDLPEPVPTPNGVKHPNGVPYIALSRSIGSDENAEGPEVKRGVAEVFEVLEL